MTPLHVAALTNSKGALELLLQAGAYLEAKTTAGYVTSFFQY